MSTLCCTAGKTDGLIFLWKGKCDAISRKQNIIGVKIKMDRQFDVDITIWGIAPHFKTIVS